MLGKIILALGKGALKAHFGGAAGAIIAAAQPALDVCTGAAQDGAGDIGAMAGRAVVGYVIAYAITWLSPKNKAA